MPETTSRTSDCLPNDPARPNTEAPAISGAMLTPSSESATRPPTTRMADADQRRATAASG